MPPGQTGEAILIPKWLRAEWMDTLARDAELSPAAYKVAGLLGLHFNRHSGGTFVRQETIARMMGRSERTVWGAIAELERRGYLIVERRDLGIATRKEPKTGKITTVRNAGGKGVANTYLPAFQSSQVTATNMGRKLAEHCEHWLDQWSQNRVAKVAADCEPTLKVNPLRKTRERVEHALGVPGDVFCEQLGASAFRQWFTQVRCEAAVGDTVKLSAPSKFVRKWLITNYEHAIVACWQKTHSRAIERVEITVRS